MMNSRKGFGSSLNRAAGVVVERLEARVQLSANVLEYRNDSAATGLNSAEVQLTPQNVKVGSFGKLFATAVDDVVYAEPLVDTGVTISAGINTMAGAAGVHNVVFVATQSDSVYAINSDPSAGGAVLWKRSFLGPANASGNQNNTLGATSIGTLSDADVGLPALGENFGITGTPVIDPSTNVLYAIVNTKETIGGVTHFVYRLHAINLSDGTDAIAPFLVGDTVDRYNTHTPIYVYGNGDGHVLDPYNNTGKQVIQFNALREYQRGSLSLNNGTLYVTFASHGDNGPYHGFVVTWDVSHLATSGMTLSGVLCTSPNNGESGIWEGGGKVAIEPDGSAFYFMTGNGTGGAPTLGSDGLPTNANYNEALVKATADPTTSPTRQGPNGWGLKVVDYFIPYNVSALDGADSDFGSGGPLLLPDSAGIPGHPHLIVAGGKDGRLYLLDRDNLGHFSKTSDAALNSVLNSSGNRTPPNVVNGTLSTPAYYNGRIYAVSGYHGSTRAFTIGSTGMLVASSTTLSTNFGYLPGGPMVSSNGTNNGIVWVMDHGASRIHAYDANSLSTELWNSGQAAGGADNFGSNVKFACPTVANGQVFVGTSNSLAVYGLTPPPGVVPKSPVLAATTLSSSSINLTWTDASVAPNIASGYLIEKSTDNVTFKQIATSPAGSTSISIGGLSASTTYYFRIRGYDGVGDSSYSNTTQATTSNVITGLNFANGFANAGTSLKLNGSAAVKGTLVQLTDAKTHEASSLFSSSPVGIRSSARSLHFS